MGLVIWWITDPWQPPRSKEAEGSALRAEAKEAGPESKPPANAQRSQRDACDGCGAP